MTSLKSKRRKSLKRKAARARRKLRVYAFFGGRCQRCGFADVRALQLDHIRGGGHKHRLELKASGKSSSLYPLLDLWIRTGDQRIYTFQLLCANCNWIKRYERQELNRK